MLYHVIRVINFISILKKTSASGSLPSTAINRHQPLQSSFSWSWPLPGYWFHRLYHDGSSTHKRMDLFGALLLRTQKTQAMAMGQMISYTSLSEGVGKFAANNFKWRCLVISAPTSPSMLHPSRPVLPHMWALEDNSTWPWQLKADKLMPVETMLGISWNAAANLWDMILGPKITLSINKPRRIAIISAISQRFSSGEVEAGPFLWHFMHFSGISITTNDPPPNDWYLPWPRSQAFGVFSLGFPWSCYGWLRVGS